MLGVHLLKALTCHTRGMNIEMFFSLDRLKTLLIAHQLVTCAGDGGCFPSSDIKLTPLYSSVVECYFKMCYICLCCGTFVLWCKYVLHSFMLHLTL